MNLLDRLDRALASYLDRNALREEISRIREGVSAEESEAVARRELLETVVDTVPIAIVLLDELGKIRFTNHEARELFFEQQRLEGQNFLQLLGAVPEGLRNALLSETDHIFSFGSDGETETYHLSRRHFAIGSERAKPAARRARSDSRSCRRRTAATAPPCWIAATACLTKRSTMPCCRRLPPSPPAAGWG
jgi:PAS domain S-box-containing protein